MYPVAFMLWSLFIYYQKRKAWLIFTTKLYESKFLWYRLPSALGVAGICWSLSQMWWGKHRFTGLVCSPFCTSPLTDLFTVVSFPIMPLSLTWSIWPIRNFLSFCHVSHFKGIYFAFYEKNIFWGGPWDFWCTTSSGHWGKSTCLHIASPLSSC